MKYEGLFVTDTFQVNNKLTVTAGVRWEVPGVYTEPYNRISTFNQTEPNPALSGVLVNGKPVLGAFDLVNTPNHPESGLNTEHFALFAPRVGIAYRLTDKTVIRSGGGVFFSPANVQFGQGPQGNALNYYINSQNASIDSYATYATTLSNPFPTGLSGPPQRESQLSSAVF